MKFIKLLILGFLEACAMIVCISTGEDPVGSITFILFIWLMVTSPAKGKEMILLIAISSLVRLIFGL